MEQGDRVLIPTWGAFHVYRVADNHRLVPVDIVNHLKDLKSWNDKNAVIRDRCIVEQNGEEPEPVDLGFFRRVEPLERDIPRADYADAALTSRMKVRQANVEITDLCSQVEDAIARLQKQESHKRPDSGDEEVCFGSSKPSSWNTSRLISSKR